MGAELPEYPLELWRRCVGRYGVRAVVRDDEFPLRRDVEALT